MSPFDSLEKKVTTVISDRPTYGPAIWRVQTSNVAIFSDTVSVINVINVKLIKKLIKSSFP